jgi:hypothetical protein
MMTLKMMFIIETFIRTERIVTFKEQFTKLGIFQYQSDPCHEQNHGMLCWNF